MKAPQTIVLINIHTSKVTDDQQVKIEIIVGDGYKGYVAAKEYDAIIVTAAPKQVPTELLNQLKIGGRMVIPVGDFYQELQVITKIDEGQFDSDKITNVRFVPMVREVEGEAGE